MPIGRLLPVALAGVLVLVAALGLTPRGEAKEKSGGVGGLLSAFAKAWPDVRADYRTPKDVSWKAYARTLRDVVKAGDGAGLVQGLAHENRQVRALCARALGYLGQATAVAPLVKALTRDDWPTVRLLAADSLGMLSTPQARAALKAAGATETKADVRLHLAVALRRKEAAGPAPRKALLAIKEADLGAAVVGKPAPDVRLETPGGKRTSLRAYRGRQAVVLIFLYGDG